MARKPISSADEAQGHSPDEHTAAGPAADKATASGSASTADRGAAAGGAPSGSPRERIVEALMALAAVRPWDEITIPEIARQAGVNLADFRDAFPSKGAVLGGFARMIDRKVLDQTSDDMAGEPARERLFDILMRRVDAMAPYKAALHRIATAFRSDPIGLAALHQVAVNSMRFMLAAADIDTEGPRGLVRLEGAVAVFARTMDTWFQDDDPGMAKTMAQLDRELGRGERLLSIADDMLRVTEPFFAFGRALAGGPREFGRRMRERRAEPADASDEDHARANTM